MPDRADLHWPLKPCINGEQYLRPRPPWLNGVCQLATEIQTSHGQPQRKGFDSDRHALAD